jgi:hypothetical protein
MNRKLSSRIERSASVMVCFITAIRRSDSSMGRFSASRSSRTMASSCSLKRCRPRSHAARTRFLPESSTKCWRVSISLTYRKNKNQFSGQRHYIADPASVKTWPHRGVASWRFGCTGGGSVKLGQCATSIGDTYPLEVSNRHRACVVHTLPHHTPMVQSCPVGDAKITKHLFLFLAPADSFW